MDKLTDKTVKSFLRFGCVGQLSVTKKADGIYIFISSPTIIITLYLCIVNAFNNLIFALNYTIIEARHERGMSRMDISQRLKDVRTAKDISVYRLSQLSGVSETHIRDLERGDKNPSLDTLHRLAVPLGYSLPELLNETGRASYLSEKERVLIECFRHLSDDKADTLLAFLKTLV